MAKITLIKLGGSLITDKNIPYTAKPLVIRRLAREIKFCWSKGYRFVISHGSGSFGHTSAAKYKTVEGISNKQGVFGLAVVQQDAMAINRIVNKILVEEGLPVLSFMPSSFTLAENKVLLEIFAKPIIEALRIEALPVVFGDVIMDKVHGCCIFSGETTLNNLIHPLMEAGFLIERVIQCGNTNGVYDAKRETIPKIDANNSIKIKRLIGGSGSVDVTGGMLHKIEESLMMAKKGIFSQVIDGTKSGNLQKVILGNYEIGTKIC